MYTRWTTVDTYTGFLAIYVSFCCCYAVELTCNNDQVVEVGSSAILECTGSKPVSFDSPTAVRVARCGFDGTCVSDVNRYDITVIDTTTHLNITSVQVSDADVWRCVNLFTTGQDSTCNLEVTKTPSCHMSSSGNTTELELNEEITLAVNITDYYCTRPFDFLLQTGDTTEVLKKNILGNVVQSNVINSTFMMEESSNGSLELIFGCHNQRIPCSGVQTLIMRPLPTCNITSYRESSGLKIGDKIKLYVYIEGYQCSSNSGYLLHTGDVMNTLNQSERGMYEGNITLTLTSSHFGPVYVGFTCNGASRNITSTGVKSLDEMRPPQQEPNIVAIVAGTIGGVAFIIVVSLIIWYMLTRRRKCSKTSKMSNESPYADVADSIHARPESIRPDDGAYAEISDINGSIGNTTFKKESVRSQKDICLHDTGNEFYKSGQAQSNPDPLYAQVNKRISTASANGEC